MPDYTVVDIETSGDFPWLHELVAVGIGDVVYRPDDGRAKLRELLSGPAIIVAHSNYDLRWMLLDDTSMQMHSSVQFHDTKVMAFMLDQLGELSLDALCQRYLGIPALNKPIKSVQGVVMYDCAEGFRHCPEWGLIPIEDVPWPEMELYNGQDLETTAQLYEYLREELQRRNMWDKYFLPEEAPLSKLLVEMEVTGMPIDEQGAADFLARADEERQRLQLDLVEETGVCGFNLKAPDQVARFLYDEMPTFKIKVEVPGLAQQKSSDLREVVAREFLPTTVHIDRIGNKFVYGWQTVSGLGLRPPPLKKKKGKVSARPAIDAETLVMLHGEVPWVVKYLRWKSLNTLCNNYLEVWVRVAHDGRLHGRYDQARTETGRIASRDPNMQAIPVSMDFNVRTLFRAPLLVGDYSGLDARVAAHFSEDPLMLDIFRQNLDLYGTLASEAWGGSADKKNPNRSLMKILMLSAQYGAQHKSVAAKIRISGIGEEYALKAEKLLRDMQQTLRRMFEWREEILREAQANGFVTTITGRKRFLPDLYSDEWWRRARAERQCVASMVQGTSADIVRRAMVKVRSAVPTEVARMILSVHDEILFELGPEWEEHWFDTIVDVCQTAHEKEFMVPDSDIVLPGFPLLVPMQFSASLGDSWDDKDALGARSYRVMSKGVVEE